MLTGFPRTPSERVENVIINTTMVTQIGLILLKAAGISTLSLISTFSPIGVLVGIVASMFVAAKIRKLYLQARDTLDLIKFQRANRAAEAKQREASNQRATQRTE